MNLTKWILTAGCALALGVPHAWPQPPAPQAPPVLPDVSKFKVVERPTSKLIAGSAPVATPPAKPADPSKREVVERPTAKAVANSAPVVPAPPVPPAAVGASKDTRADVSKSLRIEPAVSKLLAGAAVNTPPAPPAPPALPAAPADPNNPTVEAGKVKWHRTLADAQAAATKSGRPVLVFHMMGQLDKQFC